MTDNDRKPWGQCPKQAVTSLVDLPARVSGSAQQEISVLSTEVQIPGNGRQRGIWKNFSRWQRLSQLKCVSNSVLFK